MRIIRKLPKPVMILMLLTLALLTVFPFYLMFIWATHDATGIFSIPPPLWFGNELKNNFDSLLEQLPFLKNMWNSVYVSVMATITTLFFCSLGGFAFAMYRFRFRNALFTIVLVTLMIPPILGLIPYFLIITMLGWMDTFRALWVPGMASAFGIFLMRQFFAASMPRELMDSARIDGASEFRIYWNIALPLIRPGLATLGLITFIGAWNNFLGPLVVLQSDETYTIPLALRRLQGLGQAIDWGSVMLGSALAVLPLLLIFAFASRQVIEGLTQGATKG